jgi:tetratricopeptide (TPR) repeat protein
MAADMADAEIPSPEIPLQEAVARELIPCAMCGARGADVRQVEGKSHFLCARCGGGSRRTGFLLAALGLVAAVVVLAFLLRPPASAEEAAGAPEPWLVETLGLMNGKRYDEALALLGRRLETAPDHAGTHGLFAQCLMNLSRHEEALVHFRKAHDLEAERRAMWGIWIGAALQKIGRSAEALPLLEAATELAPLERIRRESLLECVIDLERFDEALRMLDPAAGSPGHLRARHRVLSYQGKTDEARKLIEGLGPQQRGTLRASELREAGDFAAAFKEVETLKEGQVPLSAPWIVAARSELSVCAESGDLERLERVALELGRARDPQPRGTALFYRAAGRLMAGKRDEAKAAAGEFLAAVEATYSPLRLERMMMRHLRGELKSEELEAEAKRVSRFLSNDLLWYLALATGEKAWAKKAAEATPGRNFPYHAIQRLLKE